MFKWINNAKVSSDRGFAVWAKSRFVIEYSEGEKRLTIPTEPGFDSNGRVCESISPHAFRRWNDDPPEITIPLEKQQEMLRNFVAAMEFQGIGVVVEDGSQLP